MNKPELDALIRRFPKERVLFHYFKDKYALNLLSYYVDEGKPIHEIKNSNYRGLLQKPLVKEVTSTLQDNLLTKEALQSYWPVHPEVYLLTLGRWGDDSRWGLLDNKQTSRPGHNLVLQLNFSNKHNAPYAKAIRSYSYDRPFEYENHPISKIRNTLAWARINVDQEEALIEEIQSDWLRLASEEEISIEQTDESGGVVQKKFSKGIIHRNRIRYYMEEVLRPHMKMWDEAMLSATVWYLKEQLSLERIFYHTYETGNKLKGIGTMPWDTLPPRSLYSKLPKRFCFQETEEGPAFLHNMRMKTGGRKKKRITDKRGKMRFYLLEV